MAVVELDNLCHIAEANAEAFDIMHIAGRYAVKLLEDVLLVFFVDADAVVLHTEDEFVLVERGRDDDVRRIGGVFDSVVDKVVDKVGEVEFVADDERWIGIEVGLDLPAAVAEGELETFLHLGDDGVDVDFAWGDGEVLVRHFGALENGFDQKSHTLVLVGNDGEEVVARFDILRYAFVLQHFAGKADGGDGGLDFVGHVVDEFGLHLVELALVGDGAERDEEHDRDDEDEEEAHVGIELRVAEEKEVGPREVENDEVLVGGDDPDGLERVTVGRPFEEMFVLRVGAIEEGTLAAVVNADYGVHVDAVDEQFLGDKGVEFLIVEGSGRVGGGLEHFAVDLLDDGIHGVADADVEHVVADGEGSAHLDKLDDDQADGCEGEDGYDEYSKPAFHGGIVYGLRFTVYGLWIYNTHI